jgi:hypothetical protein
MPARRPLGVLCASLVLAAGSPLRAGGEPDRSSVSVQAKNPEVVRLLAIGVARSAVFASQLERFDRTGWLVFVERGRCPGRAYACLLHFVGRRGGRPWLRILLDNWKLRHPDREIAALAHELQHAIEVAEADVVDAASMAALFRRIGYVKLNSGRAIIYETHLARQVGDQVLEQVRRSGAARPTER